MITADLHCHTRESFDAFTTNSELLEACIVNKINIIAITEHDKVNRIDDAAFASAGIHVITGCEYTTDLGVHIIGLFVSEELSGASAMAVIAHIKRQKGLVLIPHPFKPVSGLCSVHEDPSEILSGSDFIELFNGGYESTLEEQDKIRELAQNNHLKLIASSDAHKAAHVGYYTTCFKGENLHDVRSILLFGETELFVDKNRIRRPRKLTVVQNNFLYQRLIALIPKVFKRVFKLAYYNLYNKKITPPQYLRIG